MFLGTLGASLLGNILAGKGVNRAGEGVTAKRQGRGFVRAGYGNKKVQKTTTKIKRIFNATSLKYIIKIKQDLMVFILEIIYPK